MSSFDTRMWKSQIIFFNLRANKHGPIASFSLSSLFFARNDTRRVSHEKPTLLSL
jgi:hypothetical protein